MRVNVYEEEITGEVIRLTKTVRQDSGLRTFVGIRIVLASPGGLHYSEGDDDRPGVTFWFAEGNERALAKLLDQASEVTEYGQN